MSLKVNIPYLLRSQELLDTFGGSPGSMDLNFGKCLRLFKPYVVHTRSLQAILMFIDGHMKPIPDDQREVVCGSLTPS